MIEVLTEYRVLIACVIAVGLGFVLTFPAIRLAKKFGFMDVPRDGRRMHVDPVPRIGGAAVFVAFVIALAVAGAIDEALPHLCGGLIILAVGMIDDKIGVSPMFKIGGQALAAAVLCAFGVIPQFITVFGFTVDTWLFAYPLTVAWIVAITNMVNLIDGVDGLCTGITIFGCGGIALVSGIFGHGLPNETALLLLCACLGFLPHNANPAKSFLGDAGSMFFGFMLASLSIEACYMGATHSTPLSAFTPIAILAIPIFDTCFAVVRRKMSGQRLFEGDKKHVHHRMTDRHGIRGGVALMYLAQIVLVGIAIVLNLGLVGEIIGVILLALALAYAIVRFAVIKD